MTIRAITINTKERIKIILFMIFIVMSFMICGYVESHYTRNATVISVNNNIITVEDVTGEEWCFTGNKFKIGDNVKLIISNHSTEKYIYDDEVVAVNIIKKN